MVAVIDAIPWRPEGGGIAVAARFAVALTGLAGIAQIDDLDRNVVIDRQRLLGTPIEFDFYFAAWFHFGAVDLVAKQLNVVVKAVASGVGNGLRAKWPIARKGHQPLAVVKVGMLLIANDAGRCRLFGGQTFFVGVNLQMGLIVGRHNSPEIIGIL